MAPLHPISEFVHLAARSSEVIQTPKALGRDSSFSLDSSGVAGFFGGDGAVSGMATVNFYKYRRWGGWYNTPGSYEIAKQYGQLANSRFWDGLFPGGTHDPSQLFGLDGKAGPEFLAARSGSSFTRTGHLAYLIARKARRLQGQRCNAGRITTTASVTVIDLEHVPPMRVEPPLRWSKWGWLAIIPISASVGASLVCALLADWFSFVSIVLGIVASGAACFVLGSGKLTFEHHAAARGAPPGDGILKGDGGVVVLRGQEEAVNSLTRGRFFLSYQPRAEPQAHPQSAALAETLETSSAKREESAEIMELSALPEPGAITKPSPELKLKPNVPLESQPRNISIGLSSILLTSQFLLQLLLIPQGALLGQILFVASLAVSWAYNTFLSSIDREDIQTEILVDDILQLPPTNVRKFEFGTWTAMSVFACLALQPDEPLRKPRKLLDRLIPNDTEVWELWKGAVVQKLVNSEPLKFTRSDWEVTELGKEEQALLETLLQDAEVAYDVWSRWRPSVRASTPATAVDFRG